MNGEITISKREYMELRLAEIKLEMLEVGGVENWEGHDESLNPYCEESLEDKETELIIKIERM